MKFKRHAHWEYGLKQIDIAPLIDIVFLLLIFFMLTTSFTIPLGIEVKLPKAVTSDVIQEDNIIVTITAEDLIYLNGNLVTFKELKKTLSDLDLKHRSNYILIKADQRSSVGRIIEIWDLCRGLGIEKINIAATGGK